MRAAWKQRAFSDVLEIRNGKNQREVEAATGQYPIMGSAGKPMGYATEYICEAGTTIIGRKGTINTPIYVETRFWNVDTAFGLSPKPGLDAKFLHYFCLSFDFAALNRGTTIPSLVKTDLQSIEIPMPPLEEQRRIVAVLDKAFAGLATATANAQKNLTNARALFECTIEGILAEVPNCRSISLLDAADPTCSLSYGIVQPGEELEGGLPIVRPTDLRQKFITRENLKSIDPSLAASYKRTTLRGDDLLLCVRGTTGTLSIATPELAGGNVTRGIVPIRFNPDVLSQELGYFLLRSASAQAQIKAATYGTALMQINIGDLKKLELRVPKVEDQGQVADRLNSAQSRIEDLIEIQESTLAALAELKQSLLHKAFAGELT